jgi:CheY-like chemotaxis protein
MARVLVVDDQYLIRESMRSALEQAGHHVEEATDGEVALGVLGRTPVDLVVTDIVMPNLDGFGLIRRIRRRYPRIKLVVVSGVVRMGEVSMLDAARKLGANETVAKPFTPRDLNEAVFRCLKSSASGPLTA